MCLCVSLLHFEAFIDKTLFNNQTHLNLDKTIGVQTLRSSMQSFRIMPHM